MKYNKIIRNFALMVVASSTLIACDDFLDREPLDQVSQPTFWKTPEHLDAYIVGKYVWGVLLFYLLWQKKCAHF